LRIPFFTPKLRILHAVLLAATALGATGCDKLGQGDDGPTSPTDPFSPGSTIRYAAVGASDVQGLGSSVPCFIGDCANGTGYVFVTARSLRSQGFSVDVTNLGIPTAVISSRVQALSQDFILGNFIDAEAPLVPSNTTLVTIFAGANDVNVIKGALGRGAGGSDPIGFIDQQVRLFGDDYATLLSAVRSRAPSARIVVMNLPNFAGIPSIAGAPVAERQAAQRISVRMTTTVINPLTSQNIRVVDLMCDTRFYQASTYFSDGFHPNDSGYLMMADLVTRAVTTSSPSNPPASCAQMTLVPG
jgi:lysophospholipase L1-like esterase